MREKYQRTMLTFERKPKRVLYVTVAAVALIAAFASWSHADSLLGFSFDMNRVQSANMFGGYW